MRTVIHCAAAGLCALTLAVPSGRADAPVVEYKARLKGAHDGAVKSAIRESALTFRLAKHPPATIGQLQRRIDQDLPMIVKILESNGYYDGTVTAEIDRGKEPLRVVFRVAPGTRYRFGQIALRMQDSTDPGLARIVPVLKPGRKALAYRVYEEQNRILEQMQHKGYPFPRLVRREISVSRERKRVDLELEFNPGISATYGELEISGLETLDAEYLQRQLPWKAGSRYDAKQVLDFENKLLASGLFGTARIEPLSPQSGSNAIPIRITVTERDLRTIRLGAGYSDIGPSGKATWEHRNLFGSGEHLETALSYSPIELRTQASLERPGFLRANQSLIFDIDASRETTDAYDADKLAGGALVKRDFNSHIAGGVGLRYKFSRVEQLQQTEEYSHIILPLSAEFDYRNDKLNPVDGAHLFALTGFYEDMNGKDSFLKSELEGRLYKMFWKGPRLSGAGRLTLGTINGASVADIPADERFYAGGGGSIRGYEYQQVGPVVDGVPLGGAQLLEFSTELRLQPGMRLGYAAFVDGGTVYNDLASVADRAIKFGAGLGVRYFTPIGPLRADVAYPLNPDADQVVRVQFYISLGQAF